MKVKTGRNAILILGLSMLIVATLACGETPPTATPDTQATVDAAIAATSTAQVSVQATVAAAVEATGVAAQATSTAAPSPTSSAEYVTMTEEELAALIDEAVTDATAAMQGCSEAAEEVTADDMVTQEEVDAVEIYLADAEEAIAYAEELIAAYYGLYGELATETLVLLQDVEQDLAVLAENTATITATLQEIDTTLQQGLALAEDTITQLETAAEAASAKAAEIQAQTQSVVENLQAELEFRVESALSVQPQPDAIATDRRAALLSAFDYVDAVREAQTDDRISQAELANIAQLGANASASLNAQGGPQLQRLSGSISDITAQIAGGQMHQAEASLGDLETSLGTRPSRP